MAVIPDRKKKKKKKHVKSLVNRIEHTTPNNKKKEVKEETNKS
jgi:hypothetical protein